MEQLTSYFIEKFDSGIIHILFNTKDKWVDYHRQNDNRYLIGQPEDYPSEDEHKYLLEIPEEFIPLDKDEIMYVKTEIQNKDQINFYYIPTSLLGFGKRSSDANKRRMPENKIYFKEVKI